MKKLLIICTMFLLIGCSATNEEAEKTTEITETIEVIASNYFEMIKDENTDELLNSFVYDEAMNKAVSQKLFSDIYKDIHTKLGDFIEVTGKKNSQKDDYDIVSIHVKYTNGSLSHNIVFDSDKRISGYNYRPIEDVMIEEIEEEINEIAYEFVQALADEDIESLKEFKYDPTMKAQFNEAMMTAVFADIKTKLGKFESIDGYEMSQSGGFDIVGVECRYEINDASINVVFNDQKQIAGLNYFEVAKESLEDFKEEACSFGTETFPLTAMLSMPDSDTLVPAVILVHGSGPNDMDESIYGNKPFKDIAMGLYNQGIAVLRYDKRTMTYGQVIYNENYDDFTIYDETIDDAVLGVAYLKSLPGIDPDRIFVMGHSLGANLGPLIGEKADIAGLLLVAGNVTPLHELMVEQFEFIYNLDGALSDEELENLKVIKASRDRINSQDIDMYSAEELFGIPAKYWMDLRSYNPVEVASQLDMPIALFQGDRDYQVTLREHELWSQGLENAKAYRYEKLNHLMIEGEGQSRPEEYMNAGHVDSVFIKDMADFIQSN